MRQEKHSVAWFARFRRHRLAVMVALSCGWWGAVSVAQDIQFNTAVMDIHDHDNIDLSQFARAGHLMPGEYSFTVYANTRNVQEHTVFYYPNPADESESLACLSPAVVDLLGLKPERVAGLTWWHDGQCLTLSSLPDSAVKANLAKGTLTVSIPQAYLAYTADNWDPPATWEEGIGGALLDYNLNGQMNRQTRSDQNTQYTLNGNGVMGANLGAWRFRADWQTRMDKTNGSGTNNNFEWSRYYAYRTIKSLAAKLTLGEGYLTSNIFDSFRFAGMSLITDTEMLPPNLRGYAPEVSGVAKSAATVIISQQGRVIYQTQVAAGPFRIQDLTDALIGELDVRVEEQDGSVQTFVVNTASVPYLTRPGQVNYKLATGRPTDWQHRVNGDTFASGEFSWGINNGWSLFGGGVGSSDYQAIAVGIGRDLFAFGALSLDVTHSMARLALANEADKSRLSGNSYRLSYSKRFDSYNSQITFAGYRFSERDFMTMSEFLDAKDSGVRQYNSKEMYTVSFSQQFPDADLTGYINLYHQTYWDDVSNNRYSLSLSKQFSLGMFKNVSMTLTGYRNEYRNIKDDGMYLSLSMPWRQTGSISFNSSWNENDNNHRVSFYDQIDNASNYQLGAGTSRDGALLNAGYTRRGEWTEMSANATYQQDRYQSAGLSLQGGMTATREGVALHRVSRLGGSRVMIDTDGVADIPLEGYGPRTTSNRWGVAVVGDVNSYSRNQIRVDINRLPSNASVSQPTKQAVLTEGAIGYRAFDVVSGASAMARIQLADNTAPPFGATVTNRRQQAVGILGDSGSAYLTGLRPSESLTVKWGDEQCDITLPSVLPSEEVLMAQWLLPCVQSVKAVPAATASVASVRAAPSPFQQ